jgi:hypothetical protein
MTWDFDYLVFPITYDEIVGLEDTKAASLVAVCGSPSSMDGYPPGTLIVSNCSFPSQTQGKNNESTKGGVILAKVLLDDPSKPLQIKSSYRDFNGKTHTHSHSVCFKQPSGESTFHFDDTTTRKAVLLTRYVAFMKAFLSDMKYRVEDLSVTKENGIPYVVSSEQNKGGEARPDLYLEMMEEFLRYFDQDASVVEDVDLGQWRKGLEVMIEKAKKEKEKRAQPAQ